jgi:hypothetical protein
MWRGGNFISSLKPINMKKVFVLFGIAAFSTASAQQNDVFDIQKHLEKMLKDKKFPRAIIKPPSINYPFINHTSGRPAWEFSHILPNGDKIFLLSQDNMPCVVPGSVNTIMPNIADPEKYFESLFFRNNLPGAIPNVVSPYRFIASK